MHILLVRNPVYAAQRVWLQWIEVCSIGVETKPGGKMVNLTAASGQEAEMQLPERVLMLYERLWVTIFRRCLSRRSMRWLSLSELDCGGLMDDGRYTRWAFARTYWAVALVIMVVIFCQTIVP